MEITVTCIKPKEDKETEVIVTFCDESKSPHFWAEVTVFIDSRDRLISEMRTEAIDKARNFLSLMLSSH